MKRIKNIGLGLLVVAGATFTSCSSDFLKEELNTKYSTDYFDTPQGLEDLTVSLYGHIRWHFAYGWSFATTLYGIDEFTSANDLTNGIWNSYEAALNPVNYSVELGAPNKNTTGVSALWDEMYYGIASCNTIIAKAPTVIADESLRNRCLAHAYFLRGYNYYRLAAQYGGVALVTTEADPVNIKRNYERATDEATWEQVISDLRQAYNLFAGEEYTYGKGVTWTKATAAHFLAKALLFRVSERNASWNSKYKDKDLEEAIQACTYAIEARGGNLASDYSELFAKFYKPNCEYEELDEILMACPTSGATGTDGRYGQQVYALFTMQFSNFSNWVQRGPWVGLDFQRCRPTEYTYSVFDHKNDARMWKTFKTCYGINKIANAGTAQAENLQLGDPAIVMILNTPDDHTYDSYTFGNAKSSTQPTWRDDQNRLPDGVNGKWAPNSLVLYQNGKYVGDEFGNGTTKSTSNFFCGINKTEDGSRNGEKGNSNRDVIMARLGETYLLRAECYVRQGDYGKAMEDINTVRRRAAWKAGEDRSRYEDGTQAFENNSLYSEISNKGKANETPNRDYYKAYATYNTYFLSNPDIPLGTNTSTENEMLLKSFPENLPAEDEAVLARLGVSGQYERALHFILNERTRELLGEWQRWETLSRTNTLILRTKAFNNEAVYLTKGKHELRPIPQTFIDGLMHEDGSNLTDAEKATWQNPGY